jgi:hypothetical protein
MRRRAIALALLLWYIPACTTWQVARGVTPQQLIADKHPAKVRLSLASNSQVVLKEPRVAGDSLAGFVNGKDSSVVASDVTQVAIRKVSSGRTVGVVVSIGLLGALIALGHALSNMCILDC